jgi:hypothetical protein
MPDKADIDDNIQGRAMDNPQWAIAYALLEIAEQLCDLNNKVEALAGAPLMGIDAEALQRALSK